MQNTEDKKWWCNHGEGLERDFVLYWQKYSFIPIQINPEKKTNPYAPDLIIGGEVADLKTQTKPFRTAYRYDREPLYTVTFNRKDYERYSKEYPNILVVFWVKWLKSIYAIGFEELANLIKKAPEHHYIKRKNDTKGNAKSSFLLDIRDMERILVVPRGED